MAVNYAVVRFLYTHRKLDRLVEGQPEVVVEAGKVNRRIMRKELITMSEPHAAARKQGFSRLDEVQRAVLDPGGTISFVGKKPEPGLERFREMTERLDRIADDLGAVRARLEQH
jgi:uncharacterized membrane protein YcaP (DUF421 family)